MNRATCGLQISERPTSNNVTPQETTTQESGTVVLMGPVCPVLAAMSEQSESLRCSVGRVRCLPIFLKK